MFIHKATGPEVNVPADTKGDILPHKLPGTYQSFSSPPIN